MSFPVILTRDDMDAFVTLDLLPVRQTVRPRRASTELGGQGLLGELSRPACFRLLRQGTGVQILARNPLALAEAQQVLRQAYGRSIEFGTPVSAPRARAATPGRLRPG